MIIPDVAKRRFDTSQVLFLTAYVVVFLAAFLALTPVLQVILPLHAGEIDPVGKTQILSQAFFWGALTASGANVVVGALSDRTRSVFGRRRPWMAAGAILISLSYVCVARAETPGQLTLAIVAFQIAFNVLMAPLLALFADRVPASRRTSMSAVLGIAYPLAVALGSSIMARGPQTETGRLITLAVILLVATLTFVVSFRQPSQEEQVVPSDERSRTSLSKSVRFDIISPFRSRDFSLAWSGRLMMATGYALISGYLLYFIADAIRSPWRTAELSHSMLTSVALLGVLAVTITVAVLGARIRSRKPLALAGAVLLCVATAVTSVSQDWTVTIIAFGFYGLGQGAYGSVEMGLMADVLPVRQDSGKDMGLINLAVTLPQAMAPVIAVVLLNGGRDVRTLFLVAALCFAVAAVAIAGLRVAGPHLVDGTTG